MSNWLQFGNHSAFHRQVGRVALAGALLGLVAHGFAALFGALLLGVVEFGQLPNGLGVGWLAIVAAVLGLVAVPPRRLRSPATMTTVALAFAIGLLGALIQRSMGHSPPVYPWFGSLLYGAAIGVIASRDLKDFRRVAVPLAVGVSAVLATWVEQTFAARLPLTHYVPAFVATAAYGAMFGFLCSLGLFVRQFRLERDRVTLAFQRVRPMLNGEMLELSERAMSTYRNIKQVLRDRAEGGEETDPKLTRGVEDLLLRVIELGRRWQEVERETSRTSGEALADRVEELGGKIDAAADSVARRQYQLARDALVAQLGYLKDISRSRERVLAQVHNYLAMLERLHLGVLNRRGVGAASVGDELMPLLAEIDAIGAEIDIVAEAMSEAEEVAAGEQAAVAKAPTPQPIESPLASEPETTIPTTAGPPREARLTGPLPRVERGDQLEAKLAQAAFETDA